MTGCDGAALRIAMLADFDSVHARAWLRGAVEHGHDVHAISYYPPLAPPEGATVHVLHHRDAPTSHAASGVRRHPLGAWLPAGVPRLAHALRYRRAGLASTVRAIAPDVLHAHYLVEHGFYGATIGFRPYIVSCWGSDVLVEPRRDAISRLIARWTIGRADLLTSNNRYMAGELRRFGAPASRIEVITLGADGYFLREIEHSVNMGIDGAAPPTVLSTRAHEQLYNVDEIIDAHRQVRSAMPSAQLVVAHGGSLHEELRRRAAPLGASVRFVGFLDTAALREAMHTAHVFVSVPSSDGTSVALLQAMAAGCFPIVADLPTQRELVEDGVNGFRVPLHRPDELAARIVDALRDDQLRRRAVDVNRAIVEERGLNENEMGKMDRLYHRLAGRD